MAVEEREQTDRLVDVIAAVARGEAGAERLAVEIAAGREVLAEHQAELQATFEGLGQPAQEATADMMETASMLFDIFNASLEQLESFLETGDQNALLGAGSEIDSATFQLNRLLLEFRHVALAAEGPTHIPNLNLLLRHHGLFKEDPEEGFEGLRNTVEQERLLSVASLRDLDQEESISEVESLKMAFDQHLRCMNRLAIALDEKNLFDIDKEVHKAKETFARVHELVPVVQMALRGQGPTPFPDINMTLKLIKDVMEQRVDETLLMDTLDELENSFGKTRDMLASISLGDQDSALLNEELEKADEAFELFDEALEELFGFFENRERMVLQGAHDMLLEAGVALGKSQKAFAEVADREGKVPCVKCGHYNPSERSQCEMCGMALPVIAGTKISTFSAQEGQAASVGDGNEPVLTANLMKIYEAVNAVDSDQITLAEFKEVIDWFENVIERNAANAPAPPEVQESEQQQVIDETYKVFDEGVELMRRGLGSFREYLENHLQVELQNGVRDLDAGARKIEAVLEASRAGGAQLDQPGEQE